MRSQKRGILRTGSLKQGHQSASWLRRLILTISAVFGLGAPATIHATPIGIDLGSPHKLTSELSVRFSALNGTRIGGQTLSLDLAFKHSEFVRLFTVTSSLFDVALNLRTNGSGPLDFLHGTGHLVDSQGMAIPGFGVTGSVSSNNFISIGLFPLLKDDNGTPNNDLPRPLDFSGIHFDLTLPDISDPSVHITRGQFSLISESAVFGVGPRIPADIVPEGGSSLLLFSVAGFSLFGLRQIKRLI